MSFLSLRHAQLPRLNRALDFDEAILSRIHLKVKYENLTKDYSREIWEHFLSVVCTPQGPSLAKDFGLQCLKSMALNGQQFCHLMSSRHTSSDQTIKQIAHALATIEEMQMNYTHLELAAKSNEIRS